MVTKRPPVASTVINATDGTVDWTALLADAVHNPGTLEEAFRLFHDYSVGNQLLAIRQCWERNLPLGPIATHKKWAALGRTVKRGERALLLWMPVTYPKKDAAGQPVLQPNGTPLLGMFFRLKPLWFTIAQTDGDPLPPAPAPAFDWRLAAERLGVTVVDFGRIDGNLQGWSRPTQKTMALNPMCGDPLATAVHELAHILLKHGDAEFQEEHSRSLRECEAEAVTLLVMASLGLPVDHQRGYIQNWWGQNPIPAASAQRVIAVAGTVLSKGKVEQENGNDES